jgi:hypothetical protein
MPAFVKQPAMSFNNSPSRGHAFCSGNATLLAGNPDPAWQANVRVHYFRKNRPYHAGPASKNMERIFMKMHKPFVKIDDWAVVPNPNTGSYQALRPGNLLVGRVFGHPRMSEGSFIFTSPVVSVDSDQRIVETRNTAYILGKVSSEYRAWSEHTEVAA